MKLYSKSIIFSVLTLLTIPFALADLGTTFSNVWNKILSIGNLSFLGVSDANVVVGFTRLLLAILTFTIFFAVITVFGEGGSGNTGRAPLSFFKRNHAMVISAILAIMVAVFLPASVILAVGTGWATAVALILIGVPVIGGAYFLWVWPIGGTDTRGTYFLKLILCVLLFWILSAMSYHVTRLV
ncbi:hypothetical protein HZC32_02380 [Candidatus Woesearchaeota archaeon]|nr:hypothetical protein [Candidatus Woesearchaeota archaeon]